ncbi:MAG TPA: TMEM175 family protein [bacterium]|nr:TMEM175 family protein [bacterium]
MRDSHPDFSAQGHGRGEPGDAGENATGRVEAFSDGVFAIAITLLVLELHVPDRAAGVPLTAALAGQWPSYLAFLTSFATIGIMWINHHRMFTLIRRSDHTLLVLNGLLLLAITAVPFPTGLVAAYLPYRDARTAVMVYCGTFTVIAVFFNVLWRYASSGHRLLDPRIDRQAASAITRAYAFGPALYLASFCLAVVSAAAALVLTVALATFFALPPRRGPTA